MQRDDSTHTIHEWETADGRNLSPILTLAPGQAIAPGTDPWSQGLAQPHRQFWWVNPYAFLVWLGLADYL